jgi:hypothetical protein
MSYFIIGGQMSYFIIEMSHFTIDSTNSRSILIGFVKLLNTCKLRLNFNTNFFRNNFERYFWLQSRLVIKIKLLTSKGANIPS